MKKIFFALSIITFVTVLSCKQASMPEVFKRYAEEQTQKCPVVIEKFIVLDSVIYSINRNTNSYYYTLSGEFDDTSYIDSNQNELAAEIIKGVQNSTDLKIYKDFNVSFEYIYHSESTKNEILKIEVSPDMYQ